MWTVLAAACVCPRGLAAVRRRARAFHDAGGSLDRLIARNDREGAFDELAVALWQVQQGNKVTPSKYTKVTPSKYT